MRINIKLSEFLAQQSDLSLPSISAVKPSLYRHVVKDWDAKRYVDLFKAYTKDPRAYRIYLPIKGKPKTITIPSAIEHAVHMQGYMIEDYLSGYASTPDGKKRVRIGKLLGPEQKKLFDNDSQRSGSTKDMMVCISRHPYDLAGMTTGRSWLSCMNLEDGTNKEYVPLEIKGGTIIAYALDTQDTNIEHPICRVLIKPFINTYNKQEVAFGIAARVYGTEVPGFVDTVAKWVKSANNKLVKQGGTFELAEDAYPEVIRRTFNLSGMTQKSSIRSGMVHGDLYYDEVTESLPKGLTVTGNFYVKELTNVKLPLNLTVYGSLHLRDTVIPKLPKGLTVHGALDISGTELEQLPEDGTFKGDIDISRCANFDSSSLPSVIEGDLICFACKFTHLPTGIHIKGSLSANSSKLTTLHGVKLDGGLYISNTAVTQLPPLKLNGDLDISKTKITQLNVLTVTGNFNCSNTLITEIPKYVKLLGDIDISNTRIGSLDFEHHKSLNLYNTDITTLTKKVYTGDLVLGYSMIASLPEGLVIEGSLDLTDSGIKELPNSLTINGSLILNHHVIELPQKLRIGTDLDLSDADIDKLSKDLYVGGNLTLNKSIKHVPNTITVNGSLILTTYTKFTKGLVIGGSLDLTGLPYTELPPDMVIHGDCTLNGCPIDNLNNLTVDGTLDLRNTPIQSKHLLGNVHCNGKVKFDSITYKTVKK